MGWTIYIHFVESTGKEIETMSSYKCDGEEQLAMDLHLPAGTRVIFCYDGTCNFCEDEDKKEQELLRAKSLHKNDN